MNDSDKIAILIDADNTQLQKLDAIITEVSTRGRIVVKRAYGNWKKRNLSKWEEELKRLGIKAEQQFDYVPGKNATDMALVIDAMDLLSSDSYDSFVIVSSDSDFTPLAIRLRESGAKIVGIGVQNTPESFRNACDDFLFLENLTNDEPPEIPEAQERGDSKSAQKEAEKKAPVKKPKVPKDVHALLVKAFDSYQDDNALADVSLAGNYIKRAKPDFDTRTYGFSKLSTLLEAFPTRYELRRNNNDGSPLKYRCLNRE
ncbi:MAG: NYN domain-containing protein [Spirochaetales bacterium]|nr:NYN domain-containing protein [Spirochaetales bacterium]